MTKREKEIWSAIVEDIKDTMEGGVLVSSIEELLDLIEIKGDNNNENN